VRFIHQQDAAKRLSGARPFEGVYRMKTLIQRFLNDDSGATAIEYGLIAAGISVAIIAAVNSLGTNLTTTFTSISTQLK
jgi:pilus assembly protein Flp/PilA